MRSIFFVLFFGWHAAGAQETLRMLFPPAWVTINGHSTLYYELHVGIDSIRQGTISVLNAADSSVIMQDELMNRTGAGPVIYIELSMQDPPAGLRLLHRIEYGGQVLYGALTAPIERSQLVIGPPLRNGPWVAIYDPRWERGHRRVVYTVHDKARIPGRFAIDFMKVNQQGKYAQGNEDSIQNWYGYGSPVLAVANGTIAAVRNDFTESASVSKHKQPNAELATGNYIALDLGNGRFAYYEHLQPGSIQVKPGQKVKKGQPIAALGFTGQTTGPHLHFHVADQLSPLGAEGIPFAFDNFTVLGFYDTLDKFGAEAWTPINKTDTSQKSKERPAPNTVIRF